ncbi:Hypothetical predicted protein [Pelobates cultripes]|uniref:Uncharacterized protein n=1 Tax=Pelobates cultripes TaxID=61616 RepID=A0AAD1SHF3_PELCU|nr:Hypothetical predicted protein [Pelobates cultripes]
MENFQPHRRADSQRPFTQTGHNSGFEFSNAQQVLKPPLTVSLTHDAKPMGRGPLVEAREETEETTQAPETRSYSEPLSFGAKTQPGKVPHTPLTPSDGQYIGRSRRPQPHIIGGADT